MILLSRRTWRYRATEGLVQCYYSNVTTGIARVSGLPGLSCQFTAYLSRLAQVEAATCSNDPRPTSMLHVEMEQFCPVHNTASNLQAILPSLASSVSGINLASYIRLSSATIWLARRVYCSMGPQPAFILCSHNGQRPQISDSAMVDCE